MEIVINNGRYELIVQKDSRFEDYENMLNYLLEHMDIKIVKEIDDFDTHYQLFDYNNSIIVLYYNNYLGISIYFEDKNTNSEIQRMMLSHFLEILKKWIP